MALTFEDVYREELAEIRKRRLHQWRADEIRRAGTHATVAVESLQPPDGERDRVIEGVPPPSAPNGDEVPEPSELNKLLNDLESSRQAFLDAHPNNSQRQSVETSRGGSGANGGTVRAGGAEGSSGSRPEPGSPADRHYGLVGLALSGGGVRSSTFCLGAIQALAKWGVLPKIDYLSTVSGGGFIGSSLSSLYSDGSTEFPFGHKPGVPEGPPMRHLRNYANYLAPRGMVDYLKAPGLLLRGILVNFLIILPYVLFAALATALIAGPKIRDAVHLSIKPVSGLVTEIITGSWAQAGREMILTGTFTFTAWFAFGFVAILVAYPIAQTCGHFLGWSTWERRDFGNTLLAFGITLTLCVVAVEMQPIAIYYSALLWSNPNIKGNVISLDVLIGLFSAVAGLGATVSGKLAPKANRLAAKMALYVIGLLGPVVLWLVYLMLTRWAVCGPPKWTKLVVDLVGYGPWPVEGQLCFAMSSGGDPVHAMSFGSDPVQMTESVAWVFAASAVVIWLYGFFFFNANRNSLHAYYRDRLSRAFLFKRCRPDRIDKVHPDQDVAHVVHNDRQLLHELRGRTSGPGLFGRLKAIPKALGHGFWQYLLHLFRPAASTIEAGLYVAPYHLINATINVRRPRSSLADDTGAPAGPAVRVDDIHGRKADFFLFSAKHIGSNVTTYCRTRNMHEVDHHVDLGTAMAISGAAAAPNMGTSTVRPLVFILTLLNVRLGYWLPNPKDVHRRFHPDDEAEALAQGSALGLGRRATRRLDLAWKKLLHKIRLTARVGPMYLLFEMFGLLNQEWPFINVSDGGHIENLGLYPLLLRKCRLIFAIDGERDPIGTTGHKFSALATAIRYARIDHGIDISIELKDVGIKNGKHFAVGKITYGDDFPHGWLIYVKSSLTDDENPYIREYGLKNPAFPHESTGDQFFDETQFECYRALGYHAVENFLDQQADAAPGAGAPPKSKTKPPRATQRKANVAAAPSATPIKP